MSDPAQASQRLAMVADVRGWAFDNIACNVAGILQDRATMDIVYSTEMQDHALYRSLFIDNQHDHVHFLWREPYLRLFFDDDLGERVISGLAHDLGCDRSTAAVRLADGMGRTTLTFGVYDHVHLDDASVEARRIGVALADGYTVSSMKLSRAYPPIYAIGPTVETPDGVDRALFRPGNLARFSETNRPLVIGWVGNSAWNSEAGNDPKGLVSIVRPAIARLVDEGIAVIADFADRVVRWRPRNEMPSYYHHIDVLLCASETEGTPNPVLEAMACGVPVISTDVGIVPEAFGPMQQAFIVNRDVMCMAAAIRRLCLDRGLLRELSLENLRQVERWEWPQFTASWRLLLERANAKRLSGQGIVRASCVRQRSENLRLAAENAALRTRLSSPDTQEPSPPALGQGSGQEWDRLERALRSTADFIVRHQEARLEPIERSLQTMTEIAGWQRKMLRPVRWVWVGALPARRLIARLRGRHGADRAASLDRPRPAQTCADAEVSRPLQC